MEEEVAVICGNDVAVEKWFKPAIGQLKIYYGHSEVYNPDFVVETKTQKFICEIKNKDEIEGKVVQDKAEPFKIGAGMLRNTSCNMEAKSGYTYSYLIMMLMKI